MKLFGGLTEIFRLTQRLVAPKAFYNRLYGVVEPKIIHEPHRTIFSEAAPETLLGVRAHLSFSDHLKQYERRLNYKNETYHTRWYALTDEDKRIAIGEAILDMRKKYARLRDHWQDTGEGGIIVSEASDEDKEMLIVASKKILLHLLRDERITGINSVFKNPLPLLACGPRDVKSFICQL